MRRAHCIPVISLGASVVGVLLATAQEPAQGPTWQQIERVAAEVEICLREAAVGVDTRAQTLAELPRLALAVATDAKTAGDLTDEELAFRRRSDETIELAQVPRAGRGLVSLLRMPAAAPATVSLGAPGVHVVKSRETLRVASIVRVEPRARADELYGLVGVSWPLDMERVRQQLAELGSGVTLETPGGAVQVGGPLRAEHGTIAVPVDGPAGQDMRVIAPAPGASSVRPGLLATAAVIALCTLVAVVLIVRRANRALWAETPYGPGYQAWAARTWTPPPAPSPYPPSRPPG